MQPFELAQLNADYTMFKIKSLSNHSNVIEMQRSQRELERERVLEEDGEENQPGAWATLGQTRIP